jgi:two-component system cell cycle sensor histidine kinase/response regulator CckA
VRSHGGFLTVRSEPGQGSTFTVFLPAQMEDAAPAAPAARARAMPHGQGELVLVVDDEESVVAITRQTLEAFGYRVLAASDGAQAVALYAGRRSEIALVLTDLMMPVMDGTALIAALRNLDPGMRIIGASGLGSHADSAKRDVPGVDHFLPKPYTADELLQTVARALAAPRRGAPA